MTKFLIFLFCGLMSVAGCNQNLKPDDNNVCKLEDDNVCTTPIASGTTGTLTWVLCKDGTLTISGKGEMPDYEYHTEPRWYSPPPWHEYQSDITCVTIGNEVSNIGNSAFYECSKISVVAIGNSVNVIGEGAFAYCSSLKTVDIPNSVNKIGNCAFYWCQNLKSVTIGKSVNEIGTAAFEYCDALDKIVNYQETPQIIRNIYSERLGFTGMFSGDIYDNCMLYVPVGSVEAYSCAEVWRDFGKIGAIGVPNSFVTGCKCDCPTDIACGTTWAIKWALSSEGVLTISGKGDMPNYSYGQWGNYTPWNKEQITALVINDGVTYIGNFSFLRCHGLKSVTISNSVTSIGYGAFDYCSRLASITIPNSVTSIGGGAFNLCTSLTSVTIPNSVISIGDGTFSDCNNLIEIINYQEIPQTIKENVFFNVDKTKCTLFVPAGSIELYRSAEVWKDFENIQAIQ